MKIKESALRSIIKEELIKEFSSNKAIRKETEKQNLELTGAKGGKPDIKTIGDLKKLLAQATAKKKDAIRGGGVKDAAKGLVADLLPGMGTVTDLATAAIHAYRLPDKAKGGTGLDALNVDDSVSKIVADEVENAFLKTMAQKLKSVPDETPLENVNVTQMLSQFIAQKFNDRTVSGFEK